MNTFVKTGFVATAAVALSLFGFGEVFGYGGGGSFFRPTINSGSEDVSVSINAGAEKTNTPSVTVMIDVGPFDSMALSNTADFADSVVVPASSSIAWTLASGSGEKTVFVKLFSANGTGSVVHSDSIFLQSAPQAVLGEKIQDIDVLIVVTHFGQTGAEVVALQNALKVAGFFPVGIPSTGFYGVITKAAVAKYQASTQESVVEENIDVLIVETRFGQRGANVRALQNALKAAGFFPVGIPSTGFYGVITKAAVEKYQAGR